MQVKHLPKIVIDIVPHNKQRYPTAGDYYKAKGALNIRVSKMNANHEFLVALHELIEWYLIDQKGVSIEEIDAFDIKFEEERDRGVHKPTTEPGDSLKAPYYKEHQIASKIEREMAEYLGVNWDHYDKHVNSL
jgi:hypothetical protein